MLEMDEISAYKRAWYIIENEDVDRGFAMICELAENGDVNAQHGLGDIYLVGLFGISKDEARAVEWYQRAAEAGHALSQGILAGCYFDGYEVEQSDEKAYMWYLRAAEQGDPLGQRMIGNMYLEGRYVERSKEKAIEWWKKAAYQKEEASVSNLIKFGIMP